MEKQKVYAIYVRVSTIEQALAKEGSITSQSQRIKEYLSFQYGDVPASLYQDEGFSAKDTNRPAYQRLLADIESENVRAVVCTEISRISRSVIDFHQFIGECNKHEVGFVSLREQFDTTSAHGKLMLGIFASVAQFEREQISERTSANLQARARRGLYNGGSIYGYRPRPGQKGYLDVVAQESYIVNLIFDRYLEIGSYCKVAQWLNEQGYRTSEYITKFGVIHKSSTWSKSSILGILKNMAYIGKRKAGDETVNCVWASIVSPEKFQKVQQMLADNYEARGNSQAEEKYTYLLPNRLHCVHCGIILENGSGTGRSRLYFYYRHPSGKKKSDCPLPTSLPVSQVEDFIYKNLISILDSDDLLDMVCKEVCEKIRNDITSISNQIIILEKETKEIESKSSKYLEKMLLLDELSAKDLVAPIIKELSTRKKEIENRIIELNSELIFLKNEVIHPEDIKAEIGSLSKEFENLSPKEKQKIMKMLIEKIEIYEDRMKVWVCVYKQKDHLNRDTVRVISDWLPGRRSQRTTSCPFIFFYRIVIADNAEILVCDYIRNGVCFMKLYKLMDDGKLIADAVDFGNCVVVCWKTSIGSIQIYRTIEEWKYVANTGGKRIEEIEYAK